MSETENAARRKRSGAEEKASDARHKAKFEVYGEEMIEKEVKQSGNSGRVYLPRSGLAKT